MRLIISVIFVFILFGFSKPRIELYILDDSIQSGKQVNIELRNNSKSNFCFIIDTLFYNSNEDYYGGTFINPKIFLTDLKGNDLPIIRGIKDSAQKNDTLKVIDNTSKIGSSLRFFVVKAGKSLKLKIPFNLVVKFLKSKTHEFYEIDKKRKYNGSVIYVINQNFIDRNCSKKQINSLKNNNIVLFNGSLSSNKVPLIFQP